MNTETTQETEATKELYMAGQWELMWRKFRKHKLAMGAVVVLGVFYIVALFAPFVAPYGKMERHRGYVNAPPTRPRFIDEEGEFHWRPFVYGYTLTLNKETLDRDYRIDKDKKHPLQFFVRQGEEYQLWGLFSTNRHLFGVEGDGKVLLLGTDSLGRDMLSRVIFGSRISLTIGLVGVFISLILGVFFGGLSGYFGGWVDMLIQRIIELIICIPAIPLWMALSAALPADWSMIQVYFAITVILSLRGWTGVARVIRGKFLQLKEEEYTLAARVAGSSTSRIMFKHLLPGCFTWIIVRLTISVPRMILGETALSFLGLGIRPPAVSWGTLLYQTQRVEVVTQYPWLLYPGVFVIIAILAFNFVGDGLRDAADPYK